MNHGYCVNCWWYQVMQSPFWTVTKLGLIEKKGKGRCYMHNGDTGPFTEVEGDSYCPDYTNRKKRVCGMKSVEEFIEKLKEEL